MPNLTAPTPVTRNASFIRPEAEDFPTTASPGDQGYITDTPFTATGATQTPVVSGTRLHSETTAANLRLSVSCASGLTASPPADRFQVGALA